MNVHTRLMMHLERHMYKKGRYKGDAPADKHRRGRSHFRVVKGNDDTMRVRMFGTDLLVAKPDGTVTINTDGYWDRPTTRTRLNEAFGFFFAGMISLTRQSVLSYSQPVLRLWSNRYRYYDGITFNAEGQIITPLHAFEQQRIDKAESKEMANDLKESGFKDAYPLLYATTTSEIAEIPGILFGIQLPEVFTDNDSAHLWQQVIARYKFNRRYSYTTGNYGYVEIGTAKSCWAALMATCKKNMYVVSRSETYVL